MPAVLVHGVPETPEVWRPLRSHLDREDIVAPRLPGFGGRRPDGFGATKEEYVDWLTGVLERIRPDGPIDLVGHDWGGGLVVRLVSLRPDLVRSWVTDVAGFGDAGFAWHEFIRIWQTPGAGEDFFAQQLAAPISERTGVYERFGILPAAAMSMVTDLDPTMVGCILALYRSAVDVGREWAPAFRDVPAPGLVVIPSDDVFLPADGARRAAAAAGARVAELPGLGHWWILQDARRAAELLERFWATVH
jgi:pimeloyl-ACP methyl ester carboxylesterase